MTNFDCLVCGKQNKNLKTLGWHLKTTDGHPRTIQEYVVERVLSGIVPSCMCGCGKSVDWNKSNYCFNDYVMGHNRSTFETRQRTLERKVLIEKSCVVCLACEPNTKHLNVRALGSHIASHGLTAIEYTVKYTCDGLRPICVYDGCKNETKYTTYAFKKYCVDHSWFAESEGGKIGGTIKKTWNKNETKKTDQRIHALAEKLSGQNNPFFGKKHTDITLQRLSDSARLSVDELVERVAKSDWKLASDPADYLMRQRQYLDYQCRACGTKRQLTLENIDKGVMCRYCYPATVSKGQLELYEYVASLIGKDFAVLDDHVAIKPFDIDVFVPCKKVGIEYHGLWYHSDARSKDDVSVKGKSRRKYEMAVNAGIRLIQLYDDEWKHKRSICESLISHALGMSSRKINARDCQIVLYQGDHDGRRRAFFDENHLAGDSRASIFFEMIHDNETVGMMSCRKMQGKRHVGMLEIARLAYLRGTSVVGGLSKFISRAEEWAKSEGFFGLFSYVDLRIGTGNGYNMIGFVLDHDTKESFEWTDLRHRYGRQSCMADPKRDMSEALVAEERKWCKIWGPGHFAFVKKL